MRSYASEVAKELLYCENVEKPEVPDVETILSSDDWFGLSTISDLQRCVCRLVDNKPLGELAKSDDFIESMMPITLDASSKIDRCVAKEAAEFVVRDAYPIREFYLASAIRCAKSMIAAATAVRLSQKCDLTGVLPGEVLRVPVLSVSKDNALGVIEHLDTLAEKPAFRSLLLKKPVDGCYTVRHPQGNAVEIKVVAGARAGSTLISRWVLGAIFDEWPRMLGGEYVVNFAESRRAVLGRMRKGGLLFALGSLWAPFGPAFDVIEKYLGHPRNGLVVMRAIGRKMNPHWWSKERIEELEKSPEGREILNTEESVLFSSKESNPFTIFILMVCLFSDLPAWVREESYGRGIAVIDPAFRKNAFGLVIGYRDRDGVLWTVYSQQWQGTPSQPLSPSKVLAEVFEALQAHGLNSCESADLHQYDSLVEIARGIGFLLYKAHMSQKAIDIIKELLVMAKEGKLRVTNEVGNDLKLVEIRKTQTTESVYLPTTKDGRHADLIPPLIVLGDRFWTHKPTAQKTEEEKLIEAIEARFNTEESVDNYYDS